MNKGLYEIGNIKKTDGQKKKHILQMNNTEKIYLEEELKKIDIDKIYLSIHIQEKSSISFDLDDIKNILKTKKLSSLIIEYNETPLYGRLEKRILIRDNVSRKVAFVRSDGSSFECYANLCFVISTKGKIVTVYWNKTNDNHYCINWDRYDANLKIIKE